MKTTVEIPDALLREVKRYGLARGMSFRQVVESSLRNTVAAPREKSRFRLKDGSFRGEGMVRDYSWSEIQALIYGEPGR